MRYVNDISRLQTDIGTTPLHDAVNVKTIEPGIFHPAANDHPILPILFFQPKPGGDKFQDPEIHIPQSLVRTIDVSDNAAHGFRTDRNVNVIPFFEFYIVPTVSFFNRKRKIYRQDFSVSDNDTVLIISGIQHLVIKVPDCRTSSFCKEVRQPHPVGKTRPS